MQKTTETSQSNTAADDKQKGVNHLLEQATAAAHPVIDQFSAKAHETVNRLASAASHGAENFDTRKEQLNASSERIGNSLREHIQRRPVTALSVAIATGFALSWLLKSRVG